jgi:putative ABC transport system permease protein
MYRVLMRLLPARFRRDFGAEMEAVLLERLRDSGGTLGRGWILLAAAMDVVGSAAAERAREFRDRRGGTARMRNVMDIPGIEVRFAFRSLVRRPGHAAMVVTTLGLGVGVSIAIFSVVHAVLLEPLPYPDADRIVSVETLWTNTGQISPEVSGPDFLDWQSQNDVFESLAVSYGGDDFAAVVNDRPIFVNPRYVSSEFFAVFGQVPAAGRLLTANDIPAGEPTVAVVAHDWAVRHFGSAEAAIGKPIAVYDNALEIIGVVRTGFRYPGAADLWLPWRTTNGGTDRSHHNYRAVGKLRPGVDLTGAGAQMRSLGDQLALQYPQNRFKTVTLIPLQERLTGDVRAMLWVLMGAVLLVLLIACANGANLMLGRAADRKREIALRAALGAGRARVAGQLLTESCVLGSVAGVAGLLLAFVLVPGLMMLAPANLPRIEDVRIDMTVLLFGLGLTFVTTLLFGLVPAIHTSRLDLSRSIAQSDSRGTTSSGGGRTRAGLVVAEVALSVMLLSAAGLLLRSFQALQHVDLGFATERVLVATTDYAVSDRLEIRQRSRVYGELLDRLRAVPGVAAAAGVAYLGMGREPRSPRDLFIRGRPDGAQGERPQAELHAVTPEFFATLEIPIRSGRDFVRAEAWEPGAQDDGRLPVAIINEALAQTAFQGDQPVGRHVRTATGAPWMEIVGVVADTRWQDPGSVPPPVIYVPSTQDWGNSLSILTRTSLDETALAATLRALLHEANPTVPVRFETMHELFEDAIAFPRFRARLITAFACAALLLAAFGIFAVLACLVARRTREIAVRRAMGATTLDVIRLIIVASARLITLGLALGLAGALSIARLLDGLLYGISPWDIGTHLGGLVVLGSVALLATLVPVIRAAGIAPLIALREE